MRAPLIGITTSELRAPREHVNRPESEPPIRELALGLTYPEAVARAGGIPVIVPPYTAATIGGFVDHLDALCLSGGPDLHPSLYGAEPDPHLGPTDVDMDRAELSLARAALDRDLPVLGICRGHELLNVAYGGTLVQDVPGHRQTEPGRHATHGVRIEPGSLLAACLGATEGRVNSFHHQAVERLGAGLQAVAWSDDGLVEGLEDPSRPWVLGVQWHAEGLIGAPDQEGLFRAFVAAAGGEGLDRAANAA